MSAPSTRVASASGGAASRQVTALGGGLASRRRAGALAPTPVTAPAPRPRVTVAPRALDSSAEEGAPEGTSAQDAIAAAAATSFSPASAAPATLAELDRYPTAFLVRRWLTFLGIVFGYACFYLTRNSLTYTAPAMVADKSLGIGLQEIGTMTSIFPIAYGTSKFVSGVLGSRTSPRALLAGGLAVTALLNIAFGSSTALLAFCAFWAANGTLQGVGAPCCARILTSWFATSERGTYWGMWNVAHNMGGFAAPVLVGAAAKRWGWRAGMFAPGAVSLGMAATLLLLIRDTPESAGFPPVEARGDKEAPKAASAESSEPAKQESLVSLLVSDCLKNPFVVLLALTYFFVYVVRQGVTSWFVFYLLQVKGVADAGSASLRVSGLELGGLFGSLVAGRLSDLLIARSNGSGTVGKRIQVMIAYTIGIAASLAVFASAPASATALQWGSVFAIGFFLYGPQMLVGLAGAELVRPESVGASQGFLGWIAYLGAAGAGIPLAAIVKTKGWNAYFATLLAACVGAIALLAPMINARSYNQSHAKKE